MQLHELSILQKDSNLTLSITQPYNTSSSIKIEESIKNITANEVILITISMLQYGSTENIRYYEYIYVTKEMQSATTMSSILLYEFPELIPLVEKLVREKPLDDCDKLNLYEIAKAVGWNIEDVIDELKNLWKDPSERANKYREFFDRMYKEAIELVNKDSRQAAEKLWGAVIALIKLHTALKGIFIAHWSHGKLRKYINSNIEAKYRSIFHELITKSGELHRYFYEGEAYLDQETFRIYWNETIELINKAKEIIDKCL
jgi:hypothetical protein